MQGPPVPQTLQSTGRVQPQAPPSRGSWGMAWLEGTPWLAGADTEAALTPNIH